MPRERVDARAVAHAILVRVDQTDAFADVLVADRLAGAALSPVDQALVTRLVYGTLAWRGRLDHHLRALVRTPLDALDPPVRAALRLGLYQLVFLDRIPAYAAVDASVRLARGAGRGAAGLVNAVLRRAASAPDALALPDPGADPIERLAVEWSHPRWLVERWMAEIGADELPRLLAANNERATTAVRANRLRTTPDALRARLAADGIPTTPGVWARDALRVEHGAARVRRTTAWRDGDLAFQGEASQLIAPLLDPPPGARVLDACAAPGGKTTHAAALLRGSGTVVALDRRARGAGRIVAEARRLGADEVHVAVGDARRPPFARPFDGVLVDAPCSGLGTLRRHPELRWRRRPEDIARLATLQREILANVAPLVRPGGVLVYAVCTITREETEDVVAWFRSAHPGFVAEDARTRVPPALVTPAGTLRTLPHRHGLDGFFAARLRLDSSAGLG